MLKFAAPTIAAEVIEASVREDGSRAITRFTPMAVGESATQVEARLLTGRTHQIRVHAAHIGHPILGDDKYGDFDANKRRAKTGLKRMFLHAANLEFRHPASEDWVRIEAPLAPELQRFQTSLSKPRGKPAA